MTNNFRMTIELQLVQTDDNDREMYNNQFRIHESQQITAASFGDVADIMRRFHVLCDDVKKEQTP